MTFLLIGAAAAVVAFLCGGTVTSRVAGAVVGFLFGWFFSWSSLPVLTWGFTSVAWIAIVFPAAIGFGLGALLSDGRWTLSNTVGAAIAGISLVAVLVIPAFSWPVLGNSSAYYGVIGQVPESVFHEDVSPNDTRYLRGVDLEPAQLAAESKRADDQALGGRVVNGNMNIQQVRGVVHVMTGSAGKYSVQTIDMNKGYWWVGPLNHNGFRRWSGGDIIPPFKGTTTPGYVMTSATDQTVSYMVKGVCQPEGEGVQGALNVDGFVCDELSLRYMNDDAYFGDYLMRHLYNNGYNNVGLTDASFEIDNTGRPFWVVTTYERAVGGFGGRKATGVVVVDPETGDITPYSVESAPKWVDRIQPEDFVREQISWWGQFSGTWWNGTFGQKINVIEPTEGTRLTRGADGNMYWYTDLQLSSSENDRASVGFVLVNARTGEARQYRPEGGGFTVSSVRAAIEGHSENLKNYTAGSLILYNVGGVPTYFTALSDTSGRIKAYGFADYQTAAVVGYGTTHEEALRSYQRALNKDRGTTGVVDLVDAEKVLAAVTQITSETMKDGVVYYLRLEGQEGVEFFGNSASFIELKWTEVGDEVVVYYSVPEDPNMKETSISVEGFDRIGDPLQGE